MLMSNTYIFKIFYLSTLFQSLLLARAHRHAFNSIDNYVFIVIVVSIVYLFSIIHKKKAFKIDAANQDGELIGFSICV